MLKYLFSKVLFLGIIFNIVFADPSGGQWKQFVYTDGLSSNYIFDVEKDADDRLWIGTQNGITLFDGNNIIKYGADSGLPAANIIKIISVGGTTYAATSGQGIYVFNGEAFERSQIIKGSDVYAMAKIDGGIFISTNLENIIYDGADVSFMGKGFPNTKVRNIFSDGDQHWFVADDRIISKSSNGYVTEKIKFSNSKTKIQSFMVDGDLEYFGTNQGLWSRKNKGELSLIKNLNILCLSRTLSGEILAGTKKGLYYLEAGRLINFRPDGEEHQALGKTSVRDIEVVSGNEIWYSTFGMGLYLHDLGTFQNLDSDDGLDVGGMVFDMAVDGQDVFIATRNGLYKYQNNKVKAHYTKKDGLPSNTILDLDLDSKGNLWLATANGLSKLSGAKFKNYNRADGLPSKLVTAVHVDNNDDSIVWSGSENSGITRLGENGFFTYAVQDGLPSNSIRDITQSDNGDLIIACYKAGVASYDGKTFKLFHEGLDDKRVILVTNGPNGTVWAGTESAGIGVLENDSFKMIRDSDGLAHNEMFSLFNDGKRMWAGTFGGGLSCLSNNTWFTLRESDGLISNTIGAIAAIDNNHFILGGKNGVSVLRLADKSFKLDINRILTPKTELSLNDIKDSDISGIVKDRFFITTNPRIYNPSGSKVKYRTRISREGEKDSWSELQALNIISFLPEEVGSYTLDIQAVDNRVSFSEVVTIPFKIGRVWYLDPKTAIPFWGSILLLIGFSLVTYVNYRKKSKEAEDLRQAEIERQQAEMEEAREFQQAMLPSEMPSTDDYEMVGFQQTATEVGGDFFDFMQKEDGRWIGICGDATGHGLTSGNVVSITKTAMSSLVEEDPVPTLDALNTTLLKMNIGLNRMCLNIANIGKDSIKFSSAGMPPAYYYSAEKGELEEILVGALPLGSFPGAIHMEQEIPFKNKGDILVMMSDGLPEAENNKDEMVGYERTLEKIESLVSRSAEEIKDGLVEMCNTWLAGDAELKDDMTFVIIKRK